MKKERRTPRHFDDQFRLSRCFTLNQQWLVIFGSQGSYRVAEGCFPEFCVLGGILMVMAIWRHRANIKRLLTGTENKLGASKKQAGQQ